MHFFYTSVILAPLKGTELGYTSELTLKGFPSIKIRIV